MTPISSTTPPSPREQQQKQNKKRFRRTKQKMEYELNDIYRRLCNGETDFQIMTTLCIQERNYYKYKKRLEARIMEYQHKKTDNTIFRVPTFKETYVNFVQGIRKSSNIR